MYVTVVRKWNGDYSTIYCFDKREDAVKKYTEEIKKKISEYDYDKDFADFVKDAEEHLYCDVSDFCDGDYSLIYVTELYNGKSFDIIN